MSSINMRECPYQPQHAHVSIFMVVKLQLLCSAKAPLTHIYKGYDISDSLSVWGLSQNTKIEGNGEEEG